MKDISHPSIIYNERREEIESIHKNNQSTHSYQESVKEILTPLQTKQNNATANDNNNINYFNSFNADNFQNSYNNAFAKPNILNFSNMKEGEQVEFNKSLFALVTQFVTKINRFKASCLKTKYPIYEDPQI